MPFLGVFECTPNFSKTPLVFERFWAFLTFPNPCFGVHSGIFGGFGVYTERYAGGKIELVHRFPDHYSEICDQMLF